MKIITYTGSIELSYGEYLVRVGDRLSAVPFVEFESTHEPVDEVKVVGENPVFEGLKVSKGQQEVKKCRKPLREFYEDGNDPTERARGYLKTSALQAIERQESDRALDEAFGNNQELSKEPSTDLKERWRYLVGQKQRTFKITVGVFRYVLSSIIVYEECLNRIELRRVCR